MSAMDGENFSSDEQPIDLSVKQLTSSSVRGIQESRENVQVADSSLLDCLQLEGNSLIHPLLARTYGQLAAARYLLSTQATSGNPIINQLIYDQLNAPQASSNSLAKLLTKDETNNHYHLNDHQSTHQHTSPPFTSAASVFNIDYSSSTLASILPYLLLTNNPHLNQRLNLLKGINEGGTNLRSGVRHEKGRKHSSTASASHDQQVVSTREPELRFPDTTDYVGDDEDEGEEEDDDDDEQEITRGLVHHCGRDNLESENLHCSMKRTLVSGVSGGRPLTGRYVRHGTGASQATLASLRRMLELRGRQRLNQTIIPQVKRAGSKSKSKSKSNSSASRNKRKSGQ